MTMVEKSPFQFKFYDEKVEEKNEPVFVYFLKIATHTYNNQMYLLSKSHLCQMFNRKISENVLIIVLLKSKIVVVIILYYLLGQ